MLISGIGTANPPRRYQQSECWEALNAQEKWFGRLSRRSQTILKKVLLGNNGIATRHLALESLGEAFELSPNVLHARFARHAPALAAEAGRKALAEAQLDPGQIDGLIVSTCTGYLCPGLTSYVSEQLGLPRQALALDLVGQGCGAAIPNWRAAEALLSAGRAANVLSVCVEVCSAALYFDDDPGVLISACLFGDGAGACVFSNEPRPSIRPVRWIGSSSILVPEDRDLLRFEQKDGMLRNILSLSVPKMAARHAKQVLDEALVSHKRSREEIATWILHPGGRDVLIALANELGMQPADLCWSEPVLRDYGNLSSASVYFVLQKALRGKAPGGLWWVGSFGAGFSSHGAIFEVE